MFSSKLDIFFYISFLFTFYCSLQIFEYTLSSEAKEPAVDKVKPAAPDLMLSSPPIQHHKVEKKVKIEKIQKIQYDTEKPKENRKHISVKFSPLKTRTFHEKDVLENTKNAVHGRQFLAALKDSSEVAELEFQRHLSKQDFEKVQYNTTFLLVIKV